MAATAPHDTEMWYIGDPKPLLKRWERRRREQERRETGAVHGGGNIVKEPVAVAVDKQEQSQNAVSDVQRRWSFGTLPEFAQTATEVSRNSRKRSGSVGEAGRGGGKRRKLSDEIDGGFAEMRMSMVELGRAIMEIEEVRRESAACMREDAEATGKKMKEITETMRSGFGGMSQGLGEFMECVLEMARAQGENREAKSAEWVDCKTGVDAVEWNSDMDAEGEEDLGEEEEWGFYASGGMETEGNVAQ